MGPQQRNFYSQKSRQGRKSSAVQLSHAPLIGTQEIFKQQPALEEHGTVQFQPHTACKRRTVAASTSCETSCRAMPRRCAHKSSTAELSSTAGSSTSESRSQEARCANTNSSTSATPTKLQSTIVMPRGWTEPRLNEALFCSPFARPLEPDHETGLKRRAVAGATSVAWRRGTTRKHPYLFWSFRFTYAAGVPTL